MDTATHIIITYITRVMNIPSNYNGVALDNSARVFYINSAGQQVVMGPATARVTVTEPHLQIVKTGDTNLRPGDICNFRLDVSHVTGGPNPSTNDAYDLQIVDNIPAGMTYVPSSAVAPGWTITVEPNRLIFTRSQFDLGSSTSTINFEYRINNDYTIAGQNIINIADLTYASDIPSNPDSRTYTTNDDWTVHVLGADLRVTKISIPSDISAGQQVTYNIVVTNLGPDTAPDVNLDDVFGGLGFARFSNLQYNDGTGWHNILTNPWNVNLGDITSGSTKSVQ